MHRAVAFFALCIACLSACATPRYAEPTRLLIVTVADAGGAPMPSRGYHRPGYRISEAASSALSALEDDYGLTHVDGWPIGPLNVYCAVMAVAVDRDVEQTLARIGADPRARLVQPLQTFTVHASRIGYDDPYFALQYGVHSPQLAQMHQRATGRGVRVAVIDTGVDRTHPDLRGRIRTARNFVAGDSRFDSDIHGTAVAGIIAADANNGIGIVGLAPDVDLLALKACWPSADDDVTAQCNSFTLAKALTFAIEQRVDIINLSLGGPSDPLLALLVEVGVAHGIVIVAAQAAPDEFPANLPGVIAAREASVAADEASASVSDDGAAIEVAAHALLSTSPGARYDYFSGSSMAAALVSGVSALSRQEGSHLSAAQLMIDLDARLTALGARGVEPDGRLATHAPATLPAGPPPTGPAVGIEGT
jgi:subtilisin family serine protease